MIIRENKQEVLYMLKESISGFCMALADSVAGVSGGTVAFIIISARQQTISAQIGL